MVWQSDGQRERITCVITLVNSVFFYLLLKHSLSRRPIKQQIFKWIQGDKNNMETKTIQKKKCVSFFSLGLSLVIHFVREHFILRHRWPCQKSQMENNNSRVSERHSALRSTLSSVVARTGKWLFPPSPFSSFNLVQFNSGLLDVFK